MNDFSAALNNFQAVQRQAADKEKESVARARAGSRLSVRRPAGGASAGVSAHRHRLHTAAVDANETFEGMENNFCLRLQAEDPFQDEKLVSFDR